MTIQRCIYYLFFFVWGYVYQTVGESPMKKRLSIQFIVGICGIAIQVLDIGEKCVLSSVVNGLIQPMSALLITNVVICLFEKKKIGCRLLSYLGRHSLEIYTIHAFVVGVIRPVARMAGIHNYWIACILGIVLSIFVPVFISWILKKLRIWNVFYRPVE